MAMRYDGTTETDDLEEKVAFDHRNDGSGLQSTISRVVGQDAVDQAKEGTQAQQQMTSMDALRRYPVATAFSILYSTAIVMEGYDLVVINSFYGQPQFQRYFGSYSNVTNRYFISATWQTGLGLAVQIGSIIGLLINGYMTDRFGYRRTMMGALVAMVAFIFITFFAQNLVMLLIGEFLCAMPWGVFQTLSVAFASEICPVALRPYLTTYVNLCWVFGQFLGTGILRGFLDIQSEWAFRGPFAIQWVWPIPIFIARVYFSPDSPWHYVRKGRIDDARAALRRFTGSRETAQDIDRTVAMIQHTNELEKQYKEGTSYFDCFRGVNLRRTEIACVVWLAQAFCGAALMGFSTVLYQEAGLNVERSFDLSMAQYALGAVGTILSWFVMQYIGRRALYLWGLIILEVILIIVGAMGFIKQTSGVAWGVGSLLLFFTFIYDLTVGPVCYCLVAEMSSTRLRAKSVVLARSLYNIGGIVNAFIVPRQLSREEWNWGAKTGLFWAGVNILLILWTFFRLPEPKGRTYGELDVLFEHKISARRFASTRVDQYMDEGSGNKDDDYIPHGVH